MRGFQYLCHSAYKNENLAHFLTACLSPLWFLLSLWSPQLPQLCYLRDGLLSSPRVYSSECTRLLPPHYLPEGTFPRTCRKGNRDQNLLAYSTLLLLSLPFPTSFLLQPNLHCLPGFPCFPGFPIHSWSTFSCAAICQTD